MNVRLPVKIGSQAHKMIQELEAIGYKQIMGDDAFRIARNKIIKIYRNTKFECDITTTLLCTLIRNYEKVYGDEDETPRRIVIKEHIDSFDEFDELTSCETAEEKFMIEAFNYYQFKALPLPFCFGNVPANCIPRITTLDKACLMRSVLFVMNHNWLQLSTWNTLTGDHEPINEYIIYGEYPCRDSEP